MIFEEEMERFWLAYDPRQRAWLEDNWIPYQRAIKAENAEEATRVASYFFTGSIRRQLAILRKHGIYCVGLDRVKNRVIPIQELKP